MADDCTRKRGYRFKLYPSREQTAALTAQSQMVARLWNALLHQREQAAEGAYMPLPACFAPPPEPPGDTPDARREWIKLQRELRRERREAARADGTALKIGSRVKPIPGERVSQQWEVTQLLAASPEWRALSTWTPRRVADALDRAFQAFFRRAKAGAGASSGYPKFRRSAEAGWLPHRFASGCKFLPVPDTRVDWRLSLRGVLGEIRARGKFPVDIDPQQFTAADIRCEAGTWWLSVGVELDGDVAQGNGETVTEVRFDLLDSVAAVNGAAVSPEDIGIAADAVHEGRIVALRRSMSECRGRQEWDEYREHKRELARLMAKTKRRRHEKLHEWTTAIIRQASELLVVRPASVKDATASGRGDAREWGAAVEDKAAFNRHVLSQAPSAAIGMLKYKAEAARIPYREIESADLAVGNEMVAAAKLRRKATRARRDATKERKGDVSRDDTRPPA